MVKNRFHPVREILIFLTIVILSIFSPQGYAYFSILGFPVTDEALLNGVGRGLIFLNLILFSRYVVCFPIKIPGETGKIIAFTLFVFNRIMDQKKEKAGNWVQFLDNLFIQYTFKVDYSSMPVDKTQTTIPVALFLVFWASVNFFLIFIHV
ncbi:MAG: hypothetical protein JW969_06420 [Spirochaetales bacterium]|nr:hypothetical protein [Spirochaetales bacterium]